MTTYKEVVVALAQVGDRENSRLTFVTKGRRPSRKSAPFAWEFAPTPAAGRASSTKSPPGAFHENPRSSHRINKKNPPIARTQRARP